MLWRMPLWKWKWWLIGIWMHHHYRPMVPTCPSRDASLYRVPPPQVSLYGVPPPLLRAPPQRGLSLYRITPPSIPRDASLYRFPLRVHRFATDIGSSRCRDQGLHRLATEVFGDEGSGGVCVVSVAASLASAMAVPWRRRLHRQWAMAAAVALVFFSKLTMAKAQAVDGGGS